MTLSFKGPLPIRGVILTFVMWLGMVVSAHAHASLHVTDPRDGSVVGTPPASMKLYFSEPVTPTRLTMTMPDGSSAALEQFAVNGHVVEIAPPEGLANGTYLVSWRVVSDDGHPVGGTFLFSIGEQRAAPIHESDTVDWSIRLGLWLGRVGLYAGLLLGVGGVFAIQAFCRGSRISVPPVRIMLGIGLLGIFMSVGFQGLDTVGARAGEFFLPVNWQAGLATSFGRTAACATIALALSAAALMTAGRKAAWMSVVALLAAAIAPSLSGHAGTAEPQWLMRAVVFVHVVATAIWAGALIPLGLELRSASAAAAAGLERFSRFIPFAILALVLSGAALALVQLRTVGGLSTPYGTVLMIKLGLLLPIFALAAFNRWRLTSGVLRGEPGTVATLVRVILLETFLILAVLGAIAAWRFTPPPRSAVTEVVEPEAVHLHGDEAMAMVTIRKDSNGRTIISASILGADFSPLTAKEVRFVLSNPAAGIEPIARQALKDGETEWTVGDLALPVAGPWKIRIEILIDDFTLYAIEGEISPAP